MPDERDEASLPGHSLWRDAYVCRLQTTLTRIATARWPGVEAAKEAFLSWALLARGALYGTNPQPEPGNPADRTPGPTTRAQERDESLLRELAAVINRHSAENGSDTPDFVLASFLADSLAAWDRAMVARERWYGRTVGVPRGGVVCQEEPSGVVCGWAYADGSFCARLRGSPHEHPHEAAAQGE